MNADRRLLLRVEHFARVFGAILEYVRRGHPFRFRSQGNENGDLVITMTVEKPDELNALLEPGAPSRE